MSLEFQVHWLTIFFCTTYCLNGGSFPNHLKNSSTKVDQDTYKLFLWFDQISTVMWRHSKYNFVWARSNPVKIEKTFSCQYKRIQITWKLCAIFSQTVGSSLLDRLYSSFVFSFSDHKTLQQRENKMKMATEPYETDKRRSAAKTYEVFEGK